MWAMEWNWTISNSKSDLVRIKPERNLRLLFFLLSKDFCGKSLNRSPFTPNIRRQPGFFARLFEKSNAVPIVFHRNLGEQ
jgi:hypothetical protein